jgi:hypothetical protein
MPKISRQTDEQRENDVENRLIRFEAEIGGKLFGPVPKGHKRQFFRLDQHAWVWHEEWVDKSGRRQVTTTRYEVWPNGVFKSQNGGPSHGLSMNEARHLYKAVDLYEKKVNAEYLRVLQTA